jgi:PE family protein
MGDQTNQPPAALPPGYYKTVGEGQAKADFAAASAGGGWEFDPEAMDKVIASLDDSLERDFSRAQEEATWLTQIKPPGEEVGSQGYVTAANGSGAAYQQFLNGAVDYTTAYVATLKEIRNAYQRQDDAALDAIRAAGKAV